MIIPHDQIDSETLNSLIKEFVLREGTDYGAQEITLETKVEQVRNQLTLGKLVITFSEIHESVDIVPASQFKE